MCCIFTVVILQCVCVCVCVCEKEIAIDGLIDAFLNVNRYFIACAPKWFNHNKFNTLEVNE